MIGRKRERQELEGLYGSGRAELVAVYGRRRIGKTYLIDETFSNRITFRHAGLAPSGSGARNLLRAQLDHFYNSLLLQGMGPCEKPGSWLDAFFLLERFLGDADDGSRQLVFLDELPWLDTPKSGFVQAFEGFWNTWACHRKNLMVVVCGSATSWIQDSLINNHGGLYGRVTHEIKLAPFTLGECEAFCQERELPFSRYDIARCYMVFGGIPYYLGYLERGLSLAQNVDKAFFMKGATLKGEFDRLFDSVFVNPQAEKDIVRLLYAKGMGFTRGEIVENLGLSDGGRLSRNLNALVASDFVEKYVPFGCGKREAHYRLVDPFCLFYLRFVDGNEGAGERYWQESATSQPVVVWRGLAFENLCFAHIDQVKAALGVRGVRTTSSAWSQRGSGKRGAQIDLLLARDDNVVNMCEIKFYGGNFKVGKDYYRTILERGEALAERLSRKTTVVSTLITTFGLERNEYSSAFASVVVLDDLFE